MPKEEVMENWMEVPLTGIPKKMSTEYKTGDWRFSKPIVDDDKCTNCLICYIHCPEDCISVLWNDDGKESPKKIEIDYDYCKGCGICAKECPANAIEMVEEGME